MEPVPKKEDLSSLTKSGLAWNTSLKIVSQLIRFVVGVIIARILDPVDFGIMAIGHMVIHYTNSISDFGLINALVQKHDLKQIHINSVFTLNLAVSIILMLVIAVCSNFIGNFFNSPESGQVLLYMSLLFVIRTYRDIYMALLRRQVFFKIVATVVLIESICMSAIALILTMIGMRYWSLVWATILSTLIGAVILFTLSKEKPKIQYDHEAMKKIYSFGIWNFLRAQLFFINQFITQLIVGKLFGPVALGYFEKSHQLASTPRESIAAQINAVMFSSFSRLQNDTEKLKSWFLKVITIETILVVPLLSGIIAVSDHFIIVLLGEKWIPSIAPLQILSVGIIFHILNGLIASLNVGIGQYRKQTIREIPGTLLFIFLCLVLSKWEINGISLAYTISMFFISIITFNLSQSYLSLSFFQLFNSIFPYLAINTIMVILVRLLASAFFAEFTISNLIILSAIGATFYIGATMSINIFKGENAFFPLKNQ